VYEELKILLVLGSVFNDEQMDARLEEYSLLQHAAQILGTLDYS
jgi:hypothetical protein